MTPTAEATTAAPPTTLTAAPPAIIDTVPETDNAPVPIVKQGDFVRVLVSRSGKSAAVLALVTAIGGARLGVEHQGADGEPPLTIVFLLNPDPKVLSSVDWYQALHRTSPVYHESALLADSGGVVWTDVIPGDSVDRGISMGPIELPDTTAAAAAELQRHEAMGVGGGPVADPRIPQRMGTATEAAGLDHEEENAFAAANTKPVSGLAAHQWPPLGVPVGVALQPGQNEPTPTAQDHAAELEKEKEAAAKLDGEHQAATEAATT
jgi:hypothetical protein